MNINIRTNEIFKTKYDKLCKACGKNQTSMFIDTMKLLMAYCNMAEDELTNDCIKKYAITLLNLMDINYKEFNKLIKEG